MSDPQRVRLEIHDGQARVLVNGHQHWTGPFQAEGLLLHVDGRDWTIDEVRARLGHEVGSWNRAQTDELGRALERALFGASPPDDLAAALASSSGETTRLELMLDPAAGRVPWEYLSIGGDVLARRAVSVLRDIDHPAPRPLQIGQRIRQIKLLCSNPHPPARAHPDPRLRTHFDFEGHLERLYGAAGGLMPIRPGLRATKGEIREALIHSTPGEPFIFHFLGHGSAAGLEVNQATSTAMETLAATELADWLSNAPVAAVVLGACNSGSAAGQALHGVAETIARATGVPVLAMQTTVYQDFSTDFLCDVYRQLDAGAVDLEQAVAAARTIETDDEHAFGIPVLYADVVHRPRPFEAERPQGERPPTPEPLDACLTALTANVEGAPISQLFNPRAAIVPFDTEWQPGAWQALTEWVDGAKAIECVLLTGPGGSGKSRMALELARRQQARGWTVGFLDSAVTAEGLAPSTAAGPSLVLVDYAETRPAVVRRLWRLAAAPGAELKLLFLARTRGDWWQDTEPGAAGDIARRTRHVRLAPSVVAPERRRALFDASMDALEPYTEPGLTPAQPPRMNAEGWGRPLLIQLTAWLCLHGRAPDSLDEVLHDFVDAERRGWPKRLAAIGERELDLAHFERAVAIASLCRLDGPGVARRSRQLYLWQRQQLGASLDAIYPGGEGLTPDLLGEQLITEVLLSGGAGLDALLDDETLGPALTVLTRIWSRTGRGATDLERAVEVDPLNRAPVALEVALAAIGDGDELRARHPLRQALVAVAGEPSLARAFGARLPRSTSTLRPLAAQVAMTLYELARAESSADQLERAITAANGMLDAGRLDQALAIIGAATALTADTDEATRARVLGTRGNALSALGRREDALGPTAEAVDIRRRLAARSPEAFEPDLARSLNNLGVFLSELGRREDALGPTAEAVDIYRRLAARSPEAFEPDLARSLNNLGVRLSSLGRREDALGPTAEAVDIYRRLAARSPEAFEPDLADALHNWSLRLAGTGDNARALQAAEELLVLRGRTFARVPLAEAGKVSMGLTLYHARCQAMRVAPRWGLIRPIWEVQNRAGLRVVPPALVLIGQGARGPQVTFAEAPNSTTAPEPTANEPSKEASDSEPVVYEAVSSTRVMLTIIAIVSALVGLGLLAR